MSDFSFSESEELHVVAQLGTQTQCTQPFNPRETTAINSTLLLPVEKVQCVARRPKKKRFGGLVPFEVTYCSVG